MNPIPCKLCGVPTTGSVGAAGLRWPFLCQACKDSEDAALAHMITAQARCLKTVIELLHPVNGVADDPASTHV